MTHTVCRASCCCGQARCWPRWPTTQSPRTVPQAMTKDDDKRKDVTRRKLDEQRSRAIALFKLRQSHLAPLPRHKTMCRIEQNGHKFSNRWLPIVHPKRMVSITRVGMCIRFPRVINNAQIINANEWKMEGLATYICFFFQSSQQTKLLIINY